MLNQARCIASKKLRLRENYYTFYELTSNPNFDSYRRVFHRFGFGQREEIEIEGKLLELTSNPNFDNYRKVFANE